MTDLDAKRGGAPVGLLEDLDALERLAVAHMRLWCSGPECQGEIWNTYAVVFGSAAGRPVRRHQPTVPPRPHTDRRAK